ncbi:unnamed protein product [Prunus armeniaca]
MSIPMEERHFIQMAQAALKISLRKRFDEMLFGDLAELADKTSKYEELLTEEKQKMNSSKGTYYKTLSSSVHLVELQGSYKATKRLETATIHRRMLLQKAIETPHRLPKPEDLKGRQDVIQEGITAGRLKLAEKPSLVTTDSFP